MNLMSDFDDESISDSKSSSIEVFCSNSNARDETNFQIKTTEQRNFEHIFNPANPRNNASTFPTNSTPESAFKTKLSHAPSSSKKEKN